MKLEPEKYLKAAAAKKWWIAETPAVFQTAYIDMAGYAKLTEHFPKFYEMILEFCSEGYLWQCLTEEDSINIGEMLFSKPTLTMKKRLEWDKKYADFKQLGANLMAKDLAQLSKLELGSIYADFAERFIDTLSISLIFEGAHFYTEGKLLPDIARRLGMPAKETAEYFAILSQPLETSLVAKERQAYLSLVQDKNKRALVNYYKAYYWIKANYLKKINWGIDEIKQSIKKEINDRSFKDIADELKSLEGRSKVTQAEQKKLELKLGLSESDKNNFDMIRFLGEWQDTRKAMITFGNYHLLRIVETAAEKLGLSYWQAGCTNPDELSGMLSGILKIDRKLLDQRYKFMTMVSLINKNGASEIIFEGELAQKFKKVVDDQHDQLEIISGITACLGQRSIIEAPVHVVLNPEGVIFPEGSVLVTPMTRPEFVPMMRNASAVITDQGGVTSHAAIVSRELNIACIVGTKIATRVLKSGDKVKIDTSQGTIEKI